MTYFDRTSQRGLDEPRVSKLTKATVALVALQGVVTASTAGSQRPGIDRDAPGGPTMTIIDPFGNELRFCEPNG